MADKVDEKIENEVCTKKKDIVASPVKDKSVSDEKPEKENGDVKETENGDTKETENGTTEKTEVDAKDVTEEVCPVKRKSTGVVTDVEEKPEDVPEKKAKLDEAEAESNGETEVAA